jgi:hypothetical protein
MVTSLYLYYEIGDMIMNNKETFLINRVMVTVIFIIAFSKIGIGLENVFKVAGYEEIFIGIGLVIGIIYCIHNKEHKPFISNDGKRILLFTFLVAFGLLLLGYGIQYSMLGLILSGIYIVLITSFLLLSIIYHIYTQDWRG